MPSLEVSWDLGELWSTHIEEGRTKGGREASRGEGSGLRGELRVWLGLE